MSLGWYIQDTISLLNDENFSFVSKKQLTRWINEARRNTAKRTGCVRRLVTGQSGFGAQAQAGFFVPGAAQPGALPGAYPSVAAGSDFSPDFSPDFGPLTPAQVASNLIAGAVRNTLQTIPGVERYPYVGFFNPYLQAMYAGVDYIYDTIACSVNWGGVSRPTLDWMPWDDLQAYARAYSVLNTSYPSVWSTYNDGPQGEIWLFPIPSQAGEIELDVYAAPKALETDADFDVIPDGMRESIKYMAAALQFLASGRYAQAQAMEDRFAENLGIARVSFDRGKVPSYYYSVP